MIPLGDRWPIARPLALFVLRIVVGVVLTAHGIQKWFVYQLAGTIHAFADMGIPAPTVTGPYVATVELLCGLAVLVGFGVPIAASLAAAHLVAAVVLVHLTHGVFVTSGGWELAGVLAAAALTVAVFADGFWSLDGFLAERRKHDQTTIPRPRDPEPVTADLWAPRSR